MRAIGLSLAAVILFAAGRALYDRITEGELVLANLVRTERTPGIEIVRADLKRGFRGAGELVAVYAQPEKVELSILINERQLPLSALAQDAFLVVNGSYFTPERKPTGLLVSQGKVISPLVRRGGGAGTGVLVIDADRVRLFARERIKKRDYEGSAFAIQAGPRVIEPGSIGGIRSDDGLRANRTVIGADRRGRLVLAVTYGDDGSRTGATLYELMHLLSRGLAEVADDLPLDFALNLDGGPSTGLFLRQGPEPIDLPEGSRVHSVLSLRALE
jgi:exopolysaccharide biosynthesis protein